MIITLLKYAKIKKKIKIKPSNLQKQSRDVCEKNVYAILLVNSKMTTSVLVSYIL